MLIAALATAVGAGALTGGLTRPLLRRLPEPARGPSDPDLPAGPEAGAEPDDLATKVPYASLATTRTAAALGVVAFASTLGITTSQPVRAWPGWLVLATLGALLAAVDGRTTWLPRVLTRAGWLLGAAAAAATLLLGGTVADATRTVLGGVAAGVFFAVVWRLSRGAIAFGDVRLAPVVGVAGAGTSASMLMLTLLTGALAAAVHGVWRAARGQRGPFPYAPGLVAGALLAAPVSMLLLGEVA